MQIIQNRRNFLASMSAARGRRASLARGHRSPTSGPLETTARSAYIKIPGICVAPQYVAEELLRAEGFTEVRYVVPAPVGPGGAGRQRRERTSA